MFVYLDGNVDLLHLRCPEPPVSLKKSRPYTTLLSLAVRKNPAMIYDLEKRQKREDGQRI
jgi:hypothetical protein